MQKIPYNVVDARKQTKFKIPIEKLILNHNFDNNPICIINLFELGLSKKEEHGFEDSCIVIIDEKDSKHFLSDYNSENITFFCSRIKAAASALKSLELYGKFKITHCRKTCEVTIVHM